ncbi:TPA: IS30 family transposase, partial [Streptococcus agalactiae]
PPIPKAIKEGRRYEDFIEHMNQSELNSWLEMDTVIGRIGGKVLLTFNVAFCNFIFAKLMDSKTAIETAKHIQVIKRTLYDNKRDFFELFPV